MNNRSRNAAALLILFVAGCANDNRTSTVAEYRPRIGPSEKPAPASDVYVLWRWVPEDAGAKRITSGPVVVHQVPQEISQAYASRGSPVGFRRCNGRLIAVAGPTRQPLVEAHYTWQTLPGSAERPQRINDPGLQVPSVIDAILLSPILAVTWIIQSWTDTPDTNDYQVSAGNGSRAQHSQPRTNPPSKRHDEHTPPASAPSKP